MALEYVGGKTASITGSSSTATNVSLTDLSGGLASAPAAGDIVIVAYATCSTIDYAIGVNTAGYAEIAELYANDTNDANLSVSWKIMGSTPDTTVAISATGSGNVPGVVAIHVWRGGDGATPLDVTSTTSTGVNGWVPNPPAITPITSNAQIIVIGAGAGGSSPNNIGTLSSSELNNFVALSNAGGLRSSGVGMGSFAWTSGAFDPAAFSVTGTDSVNNSSASLTLALRPAAESGGSSGAGTSAGVGAASGVGSSIASAAGSAAGGSTASGVGADGAAAAPASALSFLEGRADAANAASYTFTAVSLGDEAATRKIAVAVAWRSAGTTNDITGVTIAGVSATQVTGGRNTTGSNISATAIWIADVPTGATGSIVVSLASDAVRLGIAAYRLVGVETLRTSGTSLPATGGAQTLSATVTLPSSGHTIAVTFNGAGQSWISAAHDDLASGERSFSVANASTNATWTGLTEDYDASLEATNSTYSALAYAVWDVVEASGSGVVSGAGSSAGAATVLGTGAATIAGAGASSGAATVTGAGAALVATSGSSSGVATASGVASSIAAVVGTAAGTATVNGSTSAQEIAAGAGTASGSATVAGAGSATLATTGTAAGSATANGSGTAVTASTGGTSGTGAASGAGSTIAAASGSASGAATVSGVGQSLDNSGATGSASGAATVSGVGRTIAAATGTASAGATVTAAGRGIASGAGSSSGAASVSGAGASRAGASGSSAGTAAISGTGTALVSSIGSASGQATITGAARTIAGGIGQAQGTATAQATGAGYSTGAGVASGFGVAVGEGRSIARASGSAQGLSAANGAGIALVPKPASGARNVRNEREPREAGSVTVAREVAGQPGDRVASIDRTARATTSTRQRRAA